MNIQKNCIPILLMCGPICFCAVRVETECVADEVKQASFNQSPDTSREEDLIELINHLDDDDFEVRQNAETQLRRLDSSALPELKKLLPTTQLEARYRLGKVILGIQKECQTKLLDQINAGVIASAESLPGWSAFSNTVGETDELRQLFIEMHREEPALMQCLGGSELLIEKRLANRCFEVQHGLLTGRRYELSPMTACVLLYLSTLDQIKLDLQTSSALSTIAHRSTFRKLLDDAEKGASVRLITGYWIRECNNVDPYRRLLLATRHELVEGLVPARKILEAPGPTMQTQYAILAFARLGTREHLTELLPLLEMDGRLSPSRMTEKTQYTCEVRDVALAAVLHLLGEEPKEFGFTRIRGNTQTVFYLNTAGFASPEDRTDAFEQWHDYAKAHALKTTEVARVPSGEEDASGLKAAQP